MFGIDFIFKKTQFEQFKIKSQPILDNRFVLNYSYTWLIEYMSTESLNRTSVVVETPTRVNVDVLKQRLVVQKKKEKIKKTVIFSTVCVSLGVLTLLTY